MTTIFTNSDFWIESLQFTIVTGAAAGITITAQFTLAKPGRYVGHSFSMQAIDGGILNFDKYNAYIAYEGTASDAFTYGQSLTTVRMRVNQLDAVSRSLLFRLIIFMRK